MHYLTTLSLLLLTAVPVLSLPGLTPRADNLLNRQGDFPYCNGNAVTGAQAHKLGSVCTPYVDGATLLSCSLNCWDIVSCGFCLPMPWQAGLNSMAPLSDEWDQIRLAGCQLADA